MAYSSAGLTLLLENFEADFRLWHYRSTDDIAAANTSGYFADGVNKGMKPGDIVLVDDSNSSARLITIATVNDIASQAADIGVGVDITATDGD
jgi:hypothetical protein